MKPLSHSGHDYEELTSRWKSLNPMAGLDCRVFAVENGQEILILENASSAAGETGGIYVSSGVHGDECAPPWALLQWAESNPAMLQSKPVVILPCLNPHGFIENTRHDHLGTDLNRNFQNRELPLIARWQDFLAGRKFDLAINLHEDFDALGIYLYEIVRTGSRGDELLEACSAVIPRETASTVDGAEFENGLLSHATDGSELQRVVDEDLGGGCPEAIWLAMHHATDSFTFESPSEMALERRIAAHQKFLETVTKG